MCIILRIPQPLLADISSCGQLL